VSPAKMAEPIDVPLGMWTWVGPVDYVLDKGPDSPLEGALLREDDVRIFPHATEHHSQWP